MKIADGIYSMSQRKGGRVHAFLLDHGDGLTLIDTLYDDDAAIIVSEIQAMGRSVSELKRIIITHAHRSHLGGLAIIRGLSNALVWANTWEAPIIQGQRKAEKVGIWPKKPYNLEVWALQLGLAAGVGSHVPCQVNCPLTDGSTVGPLEVIAVPGHTPGSMAFWWPEKRALFAGDVLATWPEVTPGWEGFTLDEEKHRRSVHKLADLSSAEILCVGHGDPIVSGAGDVMKELAKSV